MASVNTNLDVLNQKLDAIAVSVLTALHNIIIERQYLEDNLKEGYINLAKSRYIMNGQKIGILQVNTSTLKSSLKSYSSESNVDGIVCKSFAPEDDIPMKENKLKHRTTDNEYDLCEDFEDKLSSLDSTDCKNSKKEHSILPDDPIKWFGVLIPESLKTSQKRFKQATYTSMKIASLQNELKALCSQYKNYRLQKKQLK